MDSINLSETQSTQLSWKTTASNTNPIACACCGLKDYMRKISQTNYFKTLNPGIPRCKHSQDGGEDNCTFPPFIPTFPFLHPFFHNGTMPAYICCPRYPSDDAIWGLNEAVEENKGKNKNEKKVPHSRDSALNKNVKHDCNGSNATKNENIQKNIDSPGADSQFLEHPFFYSNSVDYRSNAFERCPCSDSTPWTCSPFIIPIVSYCMLWNSQKHNIFFSNYPGIKPEMILQQNNGRPPKHSNTNEAKSENFFSKQDSNDTKANTNSTLEDGLDVDKLSEKGWKTKNQNSLHSVHTQNFVPYDNFGEKKENLYFSSSWNSTCTDKEAMDTESLMVENPTESEEFFAMDVKSFFPSKTHFSLDSDDDHLKENSSKLQLGEPKGNSGFESCEEDRSDLKPGEDCLSLKESYTNISDQRRQMTPEEGHGFNVAAGDAGGEHCVGYKVYIPTSEEHKEVNLHQEIQADTNIVSQVVKGLAEQKGKTSESSHEKATETNKRNCRVKTGFAQAESRSNSRHCKEINMEEPTVMKRKHACFPSPENSVGQNENKSKIQKIKNHAHTKQQDLGSGRVQKTLNAKTQFSKKCEKVTSLKTPLHGTQMQANDIVKNRKK